MLIQIFHSLYKLYSSYILCLSPPLTSSLVAHLISSRCMHIRTSGSLRIVMADTEKPKGQATLNDDGLDQKTLFVRAIPTDATNEELSEFFSQFCPVKHAVIVNDSEQKSRGFGFVSFTEEEDTLTALVEAKKTKFKGRFLRVDVAKRRERKPRSQDGEEAPSKPKAEPVEKRRARLIVRNLPWSCKTPDVLKKTFSRYGAVFDAYIPRKKGGQMCGFGFVVMKKQASAKRAVEQSQGLKIDGREVAVDFALEKSKWELQKEEESSEDEEEEEKEEDEEGEEDEEDDDDEDDDDDDDDESEDDDKDFDNLNQVDSDAEEEEIKMDDSDDEDEDEKPRKKANKQTPYTIFVRNIPYDADEESLKEHFTKFGPVKYALPVRDRETGYARGSAFVAFVSEPAYVKCLENAPEALLLLLLIADDVPSEYVYQGRILLITLAVDRQLASRLEERNLEKRKHALGKDDKVRDKRNLFLLNEGRITINSALAKYLTPADLEIREQLYKLRVAQLNKNPLLHLSLTRLAVRNLPRAMNSKALKALGRKGVVQFATEVKEEKRLPLSKEEVNRSLKHKLAEQGLKEGEKLQPEVEEGDKRRKTKNAGVVKQAKVIMEVKGVGEFGRSRGYGFIEFRDHKAALMGLRWLNAHEVSKEEILEGLDEKEKKKADIDGKKRRLIVEFAIENAQVVKKRFERERMSRDPDRKRKREEREEALKERKKAKRGGKKGNMKKGEAARAASAPEKKKSDTLDEVKRIIAQKRRRKKGGK